MSLSSRANHLSTLAKIPYQRALLEIRRSGAKPAELANKNNWSLKRCDVWLFDQDLDEELAAAQRASGPVVSNTCDNCSALYFKAFDRKGSPCFGADEHCPDCVEKYGLEECGRCGRECLAVELEESSACSRCWDEIQAM